MQNEEEATLTPVQTSSRTTDIQLQRIVLGRGTVNVSAIRALAIIQLIVAALTFSFGIAVVSHGENADNAMKIGIVGIFGGIIICVAGALGIISYKDHNNQNKNAFHMAFSIIGCCVSIVGIYFNTAELIDFDVMECSYNDFIKHSYIACRPPGRAFVGLLLCLAITEFLVALIASVFTCIFSCCGGNNCCDGSQQDNIGDPEDLEYVFTSRNEQNVATLINRQESGSGHIPSEQNNLNQALAQVNATVPNYGATSITHARHDSPPLYEENESSVAN